MDALVDTDGLLRVSLGKILASKRERGGARLHKSLLVLNVMRKAKQHIYARSAMDLQQAFTYKEQMAAQGLLLASNSPPIIFSQGPDAPPPLLFHPGAPPTPKLDFTSLSITTSEPCDSQPQPITVLTATDQGPRAVGMDGHVPENPPSPPMEHSRAGSRSKSNTSTDTGYSSSGSDTDSSSDSEDELRHALAAANRAEPCPGRKRKRKHSNTLVSSNEPKRERVNCSGSTTAEDGCDSSLALLPGPLGHRNNSGISTAVEPVSGMSEPGAVRPQFYSLSSPPSSMAGIPMSAAPMGSAVAVQPPSPGPDTPANHHQQQFIANGPPLGSPQPHPPPGGQSPSPPPLMLPQHATSNDALTPPAEPPPSTTMDGEDAAPQAEPQPQRITVPIYNLINLLNCHFSQLLRQQQELQLSKAAAAMANRTAAAHSNDGQEGPPPANINNGGNNGNSGGQFLVNSFLHRSQSTPGRLNNISISHYPPGQSPAHDEKPVFPSAGHPPLIQWPSVQLAVLH